MKIRQHKSMSQLHKIPRTENRLSRRSQIFCLFLVKTNLTADLPMSDTDASIWNWQPRTETNEEWERYSHKLFGRPPPPPRKKRKLNPETLDEKKENAPLSKKVKRKSVNEILNRLKETRPPPCSVLLRAGAAREERRVLLPTTAREK